MSKVDVQKFASLSDESREMLDRMEEERIFELEPESDNTLCIAECCDYWFSSKLTKEDCLKLSKVFAEVAECFTE